MKRRKIIATKTDPFWGYDEGDMTCPNRYGRKYATLNESEFRYIPEPTCKIVAEYRFLGVPIVRKYEYETEGVTG